MRMSGFDPIWSGEPSGSDVVREPGERRILTYPDFQGSTKLTI